VDPVLGARMSYVNRFGKPDTDTEFGNIAPAAAKKGVLAPPRRRLGECRRRPVSDSGNRESPTADQVAVLSTNRPRDDFRSRASRSFSVNPPQTP